MPSTPVELDDSLLDRIRVRAGARGVSLRTFVEAILEREAAKPLDQEEDEATMRKFEQLGYIDAGLDI